MDGKSKRERGKFGLQISEPDADLMHHMARGRRAQARKPPGISQRASPRVLSKKTGSRVRRLCAARGEMQCVVVWRSVGRLFSRPIEAPFGEGLNKGRRFCLAPCQTVGDVTAAHAAYLRGPSSRILAYMLTSRRTLRPSICSMLRPGCIAMIGSRDHHGVFASRLPAWFHRNFEPHPSRVHGDDDEPPWHPVRRRGRDMSFSEMCSGPQPSL
jgi:hypothetical protein